LCGKGRHTLKDLVAKEQVSKQGSKRVNAAVEAIEKRDKKEKALKRIAMGVGPNAVMGTIAGAATPSPTVSMTFVIPTIDYNVLTEQNIKDIKSAIASAVAQGTGVASSRVSVELSAGSVKVKVVIKAIHCKSTGAASTLESGISGIAYDLPTTNDTTRERLESSVRSAVNKVVITGDLPTTGAIRVSPFAIERPSFAQASAPSKKPKCVNLTGTYDITGVQKGTVTLTQHDCYGITNFAPDGWMYEVDGNTVKLTHADPEGVLNGAFGHVSQVGNKTTIATDKGYTLISKNAAPIIVDSGTPERVDEYACNTSQDFANGAAYSTKELNDNCHDVDGKAVCDSNPAYGEPMTLNRAIKYCQDECDRRGVCTGFFFQKHNNGHEMCGFYSTTVTSPVNTMDHMYGALCLRKFATSTSLVRTHTAANAAQTVMSTDAGVDSRQIHVASTDGFSVGDSISVGKHANSIKAIGSMKLELAKPLNEVVPSGIRVETPLAEDGAIDLSSEGDLDQLKRDLQEKRRNLAERMG
jgi:hypothetical protein